MLHTWLSRPHVAASWGKPASLEAVQADYAPAIAGNVPQECFIAEVGGEAIGFIQSYIPAAWHDEGWWLDEHDRGVRGIDQFLIDAQALGQGIGTAMVAAFVDRLFADPAVTRVQTDPSPENIPAIRCYEKVGFVRGKLVQTPDGPALLMYCSRDGRRQTKP